MLSPSGYFSDDTNPSKQAAGGLSDGEDNRKEFEFDRRSSRSRSRARVGSVSASNSPLPKARILDRPKLEGEKIKVAVRVRPFVAGESTEEKNLTHVSAGQISVVNRVASLNKESDWLRTYTFDHTFDSKATQAEIFSATTSELIDFVLQGYNGTVFAYGQTGAGKTFTMEGLLDQPEQAGLVPRSFEQIAAHIAPNAVGGSDRVRFCVTMSMLEIYNAEVFDLLQGSRVKRQVKEKQNKVFVKDLTQVEVATAADMTAALQKGVNNRQVGATLANQNSSRSHSLLTITVERRQTLANGSVQHRVGKLNLVDLAGSEKQKRTGANEDRLREATAINLALSALGNVINALARNPRDIKHVPYRDSKLTRILSDSLGGNTKTVMVACLSPSSDSYEESLSTLRYADRVKSIQNMPRVNSTPTDQWLEEYKAERRKKEEQEVAALAARRAVRRASASAQQAERTKQLQARVQRLKKEGSVRTKKVKGKPSLRESMSTSNSVATSISSSSRRRGVEVAKVTIASSISSLMSSSHSTTASTTTTTSTTSSSSSGRSPSRHHHQQQQQKQQQKQSELRFASTDDSVLGIHSPIKMAFDKDQSPAKTGFSSTSTSGIMYPPLVVADECFSVSSSSGDDTAAVAASAAAAAAAKRRERTLSGVSTSSVSNSNCSSRLSSRNNSSSEASQASQASQDSQDSSEDSEDVIVEIGEFGQRTTRSAQRRQQEQGEAGATPLAAPFAEAVANQWSFSEMFRALPQKQPQRKKTQRGPPPFPEKYRHLLAGGCSVDGDRRGDAVEGVVLEERERDRHVEHQHMVMFLDTTIDEGEEFLLYYYPSATPHAKRLLAMKGVFSVLESAMRSVCGQGIETAVFEHAQDDSNSSGGGDSPAFRIKCCSINLGGWAEGYAFVLITWAPMPDQVLTAVAYQLLALTGFTVGAIHSSFFQTPPSPHSSTTAPRYERCFSAMARLDPLFRSCIRELCRAYSSYQMFLLAFAEGVTWFHPSLELSHCLSDALTQLEGGQVGEGGGREWEEDIAALHGGNRTGRMCSVVGSALYHSGAVVASHLTPTQLRTVTAFLQLHRLLARDRSSPMKVTYFHAFHIDLLQGCRPASAPAALTDSTDGPVLQDTRALPQKRVLGVVCISNQVLAVLMAVQPGRAASAHSDPYLLEQTKNTLLALRSAYLSPLLHELSLHHSITEPWDSRSSCKLTCGSRNVLFSYLCYDSVQGVLLHSGLPPSSSSSSSSNSNSSGQQTAFADLKLAYVRTCVALKASLTKFRYLASTATLNSSSSGSGHTASPENTGNGSSNFVEEPELVINPREAGDNNYKYFCRHKHSESVKHVSELAVKLALSGSSQTYWVVGRLYPPASECYVCYEASVPQNIVELAFKLNFALGP